MISCLNGDPKGQGGPPLAFRCAAVSKSVKTRKSCFFRGRNWAVGRRLIGNLQSFWAVGRRKYFLKFLTSFLLLSFVLSGLNDEKNDQWRPQSLNLGPEYRKEFLSQKCFLFLILKKKKYQRNTWPACVEGLKIKVDGIPLLIDGQVVLFHIVLLFQSFIRDALSRFKNQDTWPNTLLDNLGYCFWKSCFVATLRTPIFFHTSNESNNNDLDKSCFKLKLDVETAQTIIYYFTTHATIILGLFFGWVGLRDAFAKHRMLGVEAGLVIELGGRAESLNAWMSNFFVSINLSSPLATALKHCIFFCSFKAFEICALKVYCYISVSSLLVSSVSSLLSTVPGTSILSIISVASILLALLILLILSIFRNKTIKFYIKSCVQFACRSTLSTLSSAPSPILLTSPISSIFDTLPTSSILFEKNGTTKVIVSSAIMLSLTIYLSLLCQNVESNPGPPKANIPSLSILTYNCNGLGDQKKLKRLLIKLNPMVEKNCIIFLQETHIVNTEYLEMIWKHNFLSNCVKTNSAGVIILYNKQYELVHKFADCEGRQLIAAIQNDETKFILANTYFPNDHKQGITFAETMYTKILEIQADFPDFVTFYAGDMNVCLSTNDSINRCKSQNENILSDVIRNNNKVSELTDAYRAIHAENGYTWKRLTCYSRLDYIFVSNAIRSKISGASTDWAFESSDHAAVKIDFTFEEEPTKGPGIVKVNTKILEDPFVALQIGKEIEEMMSQTDESWNPHSRLEFLKVAIRSVFSSKVSEIRKGVNEEIKETEEELNQMEDLKVKIITKPNLDQEEKIRKSEKVDEATTNLKSKLAILRRKFSDTLAFVSKAKWFEYGEKSNKFFLNLNKCRQKQKLISKIRNNEKEFVGQDQVSKGITEFYRELYSAQPTENINDDSFFDNCPKLTEDQANYLDKELNLADLHEALSTCKVSSPGPDGIPYIIYKKYWKLMGPILLEAWKHSVKTGTLPTSHLESTITLLPKEGKDTIDIKNWRPITLSNCDSKIITKALSLKTSKVLESIIDPSQTAYVPGRSVSDNLRSNFFYKNYCSQNHIDSVLISLDAKKAFDSVDHKYIEKALIAYGFGPGFIKIFQTLYRNITARILINGFASESIKIERGVKQGDALSCAIFIICIDPLLRNLNKNRRIKEVKIRTKNTAREEINFKGAAYADDISVICEKSYDCIQQVFYEYERLTRRSGLELNADKTEILNLNSKENDTVQFNYNESKFAITTVDKIKICGLYYCSDLQEEYKLNVLEKIKKLSFKIKLWSHRHLTMEGKVLIVKTFGLSQIIYNMQCYGFDNPELINTERMIFKFLWSTKDNQNGIDRIKRSIMKNDYSKGGMKVTDIECLNRSLKLKQFFRAQKSNHVISTIQLLTSTKSGQENAIYQEYQTVTKEEPICSSAQETLNIIIDYNRDSYNNIPSEEYETDKNLIDEVSSINLTTFLTRKKRVFLLCMLKPLTAIGITTLGELTQAYEYETDERLNKTMRSIISAFPKILIDISKCFCEDINSNSEKIEYMLIAPNTRKNINSIVVKELQVTLKNALKKIEAQDFNNKLGIDNFDEQNITRFRDNCKNPKLRNIYFRLIHNDFFTHVRMKKYKMTEDDHCPRCGQTENTKHLLWECTHVQNIWKLYNNLMAKLQLNNELVNSFKNIFETGQTQGACLVKIKVIQEMIQVERPRNWGNDNLIKIITDLIHIDSYNAKLNRTVEKFASKWKRFINITQTRRI